MYILNESISYLEHAFTLTPAIVLFYVKFKGLVPY